MPIISVLIAFIFAGLYGAVAPAPLVNNMIPIPNNADAQLANFINSYQTNFVNVFSMPPHTQNALNNALSIDAFMQSIYAPRARTLLPNVANSQNFLTAIRIAYNDINQFINNQVNQVFGNYLRQSFQHVLTALMKRYKLVKIEDKVVTSSAFMGHNALNAIPANFQNTIRLLTGRIFVVSATPGNNPYIASSSSAMIIPDRVGNNLLYNQIITCCHSMVAGDSESPYLEFYFVRSENINPDTGFPYSYLIGNALGVVLDPQTLSQINTQNFIQYLRNKSNNHANNNEVRRITNFTALNSCTSCLECNSPKYDYAADCGYGVLNAGFTFAPNTLAPIRIHSGIPAGNYNYYAIGYPCFHYYLTVGLSILAQERNLSPFTISRSNSVQPIGNAPLIMQNGLIRHDAASAPGMSGGPLLRFNNNTNTIEVFGVIKSSDMNGEYACHF